jgi:hypothetical protein
VPQIKLWATMVMVYMSEYVLALWMVDMLAFLKLVDMLVCELDLREG